MKVAQFDSENGLFVGLELDGKWINYSKASAVYYALVHDLTLPPRPTIELLLEQEQFDAAEFKSIAGFVRKNKLQQFMAPPEGSMLRAPLMRPRKIVALGLNYGLHVKEGSLSKPSEPVLFLKAGSSVIDPGAPIRIPRGMGRIDHEVELAVVIGKTASGVQRKNAFAYVAGYTICNDVTARTLQTEDINRRYPWFRTKSFDTFTPLGPWIVPAAHVANPDDLGIVTRVNGVVKQDGRTSRLIWDLPHIIRSASAVMTLHPGDIILTGTPDGVGQGRTPPEFLAAGDLVEIEIEGIGRIETPMVAEG